MDIFKHMLSDDALDIAAPYIKEEREAILSSLRHAFNDEKRNVVVIGGGHFLYYNEIASQIDTYICVDPIRDYVNTCSNGLLNEEEALLINQKVETLDRNSIPKTPTLFVFAFNVISYIENPLSVLNQLLQQSDRALLSFWSSSFESQRLKQEYYKHLDVEPSFLKSLKLTDIDWMTTRNSFKLLKKNQGKIIDTLLLCK